ncbi:zinc finger protein 3-like [Sycon ciliatum]|uniref:zinc finger protein 3-like n=1 Tax=Sycon ciliatum TaxID=27933 RepID=UPI0031F652D1
MEDTEESTSDCSIDSSKLPPMPPLMKSKRNMVVRSPRQYGPSSVLPSTEINTAEENVEEASRRRPASLEDGEFKRLMPPEYTRRLILASPPPLIKLMKNTEISASTSDIPPGFKTTFLNARKRDRNAATSGTTPGMEVAENSSSTFSGYEKRVSPGKPVLKVGKKVFSAGTTSDVEDSADRKNETSEQLHAYAIPVDRSHPIGLDSVSSKVVVQILDQDQCSKGESSHACPLCLKEFKTASHLREHERIHTGERPFKCTVCSKTFTQSSTLCVHKRTHTGERPHTCGTCGKSFKSYCHLRQHERVHSGERPFKCKTCERSFTRLSYLRDHEHTHTGECPYMCGECAKGFWHSSSLRRHERNHHMHEN